mgnify:CR=1 FL=1
MRARIIVSTLLLATTPFAHAEATLDVGERLTACATCHGQRGEGVQGAEYSPHLAGKPAGYLFEQLRGFREGRRVSTSMTWYVRFADDAFLHRIADYYAALPPRTRSADAGASQLTDERRSKAQALVERGDATRGVLACNACHGANLAGLEPGIPALLGLPIDYVIAQFGAWREGIRHGAPPDCMRDIAERIPAEDIRAVAAYLSQQSNIDGLRPAPAGSFVPPRTCGSLPHAQEAK